MRERLDGVLPRRSAPGLSVKRWRKFEWQRDNGTDRTIAARRIISPISSKRALPHCLSPCCFVRSETLGQRIGDDEIARLGAGRTVATRHDDQILTSVVA